MEVRVQKWGNSLALRIPSAFASEMGLAPGSPVTISLDDGKLVVLPVSSSAAAYPLADLLSRVTPDNLHREIPSGARLGKETW